MTLVHQNKNIVHQRHLLTKNIVHHGTFSLTQLDMTHVNHINIHVQCVNKFLDMIYVITFIVCLLLAFCKNSIFSTILFTEKISDSIKGVPKSFIRAKWHNFKESIN